MKSKKWIKVFLTLGLAMLATPVFAQNAELIDPPACDSATFGKVLFVVDCARENCPYVKEQQGLYEILCAKDAPGEILKRPGIARFLDKVGGSEALPLPKNVETVSPCECLAALEEKYACKIEICEAPATTTGKTETVPAPEENLSGGCSLSANTPAPGFVLLAWVILFSGSLLARRRFSKDLV